VQVQVAGDADPHQVHHGAGPVVGMDTGAAGFDEVIVKWPQPAEVELGVTVAAARSFRGPRRHQPVGSNGRCGGVVADHEMVAVRVDLVRVATVYRAVSVAPNSVANTWRRRRCAAATTSASSEIVGVYPVVPRVRRQPAIRS
jgi:hypothetical protein